MKSTPTRLAVRLAASLALSLGLAAAAHADTTTYDPIFGAVTPTTGTQLSGTFSQVIAAGDFTLSVWAEGATEFDQLFTAAAGSGISFSSVTATVLGDDTPLVFSSNSLTASSISTALHDQSASFIVYTITGTATVAGSTVSGTILDDTNFTPAAAVPEPTTWALMLGGLGLVATRLNKRRRG